ncbi:PREDICTED: leucine-rich repeat-containing protein 15-like isoform X2 [Branchiostoma belcheri]|uniref:Leucine-rich repeat-containing protein 15-like isoform X2 n=1 Tax=Branchiostoma belcheri TaxID=7741 RepID=A0A6P5AJI4_BRABE|nr:PREDICTED: leucine-rich repeat-containing protein 15-like isoform X2 [Branchiostoma belcheri]XP_019646412.1 PREDICTED: leucine-rich repeat-containing protein 15-like isoform X2 [Branchiostoma belcheri]XP_019646413.1 PREDICTED: leucine-rich repeat-containing protein 15-like isoform X2 [Branchiostoma belcheri]XP_019646414.1 PREDICTED: leucine-rich repeat-containing protein 15-like isoform X2 [Branchiostoma belcheri]
MWAHLSGVLVLLVLASGQTEAACDCTDTTCNCTGISRVPQDISVPANTTVLNLLNSNIGNFGSFPALAQLQELTLTSNQIDRIQPRAFTPSDHPQLQKVTISNNRINSIQPAAFSELPLLQELSLANNNITSLQPGTFQNLPELRNLSLSYNKIDRVQPSAIDNVPKLQSLDLSSNQIARIQPNAFPSGLVQVDLSSNNITAIDAGAFGNVTLLQQLDLSSNQLRASALLSASVCNDLSSIPGTVDLSDNPWGCDCSGVFPDDLSSCSADIISQIQCTSGGSTSPLTLQGGTVMCSAASVSAYYTPLLLLSVAAMLKNMLM